MKKFLKIVFLLGLLAFAGYLFSPSSRTPTPGGVATAWLQDQHGSYWLQSNDKLTRTLGLLKPSDLTGWMAAGEAFAQAPTIVKRFRANSAGIDTVAQDSGLTNVKLFTIGNEATGTVALTAYGTMYYEDIVYLVRVDTLSTNDTLNLSFETKSYQDTVFRVPFTHINSVGTVTADAESLRVAATGRFLLIPSGNSAKSTGPMRNLRLRGHINTTSTARVIYTVSAQYRTVGGE